MEDFTLKYPEDFGDAVHLTKDELEAHIRLMAALKMFELGKISSGKAAEFAGISRAEFIEACGRYMVNMYNYEDEDVAEELSGDVTNLKTRQTK